MSGISSNRVKKNIKKNKNFNGPEVIEVKSVKLEPRKTLNESKNSTKSENNLRKSRRSSKLHGQQYENEEIKTELETHILKKIKKLSLKNEGDNIIASTSTTFQTEQNTEHNSDEIQNNSENNESSEYLGEEELQASYTYVPEYYSKHTKSIKFINQVTVLYFNGDGSMYKSMEPLKKEIDQQLRNREMRKEHLLKMGHEIDNLYLF